VASWIDFPVCRRHRRGCGTIQKRKL